MNAHQRRKSRRQAHSAIFGKVKPTFIQGWADLAKVPESATHRLEIDVEGCNGWLVDKRKPDDRLGFYLSTHTFYESRHHGSTRHLRKCGFNVTLANWDAQDQRAKP